MSCEEADMTDEAIPIFFTYLLAGFEIASAAPGMDRIQLRSDRWLLY